MADRRLQVFHAVAKHLSFTKAGEALCMTQPAVTFQVRQLEEHFNITVPLNHLAQIKTVAHMVDHIGNLCARQVEV